MPDSNKRFLGFCFALFCFLFSVFFSRKFPSELTKGAFKMIVRNTWSLFSFVETAFTSQTNGS